MQFIGAFIVTGVIFTIIDGIWLKLTANFYKRQFGSLLRSTPNLLAATAFYVLYVGGIVWFVLFPLLESAQWWQVTLRGAIFGMVAYGTYDLTNFATLKKWPIKVTFIDIAWGAVATAGASTTAFVIVKGWMF